MSMWFLSKFAQKVSIFEVLKNTMNIFVRYEKVLVASCDVRESRLFIKSKYMKGFLTL